MIKIVLLYLLRWLTQSRIKYCKALLSFEIEIEPRRGIDMGAGPGVSIKKEIYGGQVGIFMDGRSRPIKFNDRDENMKQIKKWSLSTKEFFED